MVTSVLFLTLVLLALLLAAFIYQIVTTPLTPVDVVILTGSRPSRNGHDWMFCFCPGPGW